MTSRGGNSSCRQGVNSSCRPTSSARQDQAAGCAKPTLPWLESLLSLCTECGSKAANSSGPQRRPLISLHSRTTEFPPTSVPAGTLAVVRSLLVLQCSTEQNALHTLIQQRHLTPSCGEHAPTAERTLHPARMFAESLTHARK